MNSSKKQTKNELIIKDNTSYYHTKKFNYYWYLKGKFSCLNPFTGELEITDYKDFIDEIPYLTENRETD